MAIKSGKLKEQKDFQQLILHELEKNNGYRIRNSKTDFNAGYAMDQELLLEFLKTTQEEEFDKLEKYYKETDGHKVLEFINKEITRDNRGTLDVLKKGVEFVNGSTLRLMFGRPESSMNPKSVQLYGKNILSVMEEVYHKDGERLDLVIFLNGIAIFTFELKCNTSGQTYEDAIKQYKTDRDFKTRTLMYKHGAIAHFAMDLEEVYVTTRLNGNSTFFRPFNKGRGEGINCGKGNPGKEEDVKVEYIWNDLLTRESIFFLLEKIIFINKEEKEKPDGRKYIEESLIFPRYQQLNAVRKVIADVLKNKTEKNYLIQHSAGSGKTNTIAWLAHQLYSLHDENNKEIFDTVCIVTDRIVVDRQLQTAVLHIEHSSGTVKVMDEKCHSNDLKNALESGLKIIVTTINKFSYICNYVSGMKDRNFAVIIDEAHSSTSGLLMEKVEYALSSGKQASSPNTDVKATDVSDSEEEETTEDKIAKEMKRIGKTPNVSFIAFTATPKSETLNIFGEEDASGKPVSFDLYSMKQAIEEHFIHDVLENYITYKTYYKLNKKIEDDPELESTAAKRKIFKFVDENAENICQKCEIILDHFVNNIMHRLHGQAKAMIVTSSRKAAVVYYEELSRLINTNRVIDQRYQDLHPLVAFSGKLMYKGEEKTESGINKISEENLASEFDKEYYQVLIVANKYQTGFDQKKLCAMYVDKKLHGVAAVQTLSRLNRYVEGKETFVLDFKNDYDDIVKAFAPYYTATILKEGVTPSDVREIEAKIDERNYLTQDIINDFNNILYSRSNLTEADKKKLWYMLGETVDLIKELYKDDDEREVIRKEVKKFIRLYNILIHATAFRSAELHKKYNYLSYLVKELKPDGRVADFNITDKISLTNIHQKKEGEITKSGITSDPEITKPSAKTGLNIRDDLKKRLSEIIDEINQKFNEEFDADVTTTSVLEIREILRKDAKLRESAHNNQLKDFRLSYLDRIKYAMTEGYDHNKKFFGLLLNNPEIAKKLLCIFAEDLYNEFRKEQ